MKRKKTGKGTLIAGVVLGLAAAAGGVGVMLRFEGAPYVLGIVLAACGLICLTACAARLTAKREEPLTSAKYARKKQYISACEFDFLQVLRRIDSSRYEVLPQAALVSVVDKLTETSYRNELFRIIDYIFVDRVTYAPLLLVELNDRSHLRADRKLRDDKVNEICRKAKMPLITFTTEETDDYAYVKKTVLANILKR